MSVTVLIGCQWGDEGKGKVADYLARDMDWVARFGGGNNAGHTVSLGKETFVLHLIPCGILQERPRCVIGHGTVIDLSYLIEEMDFLTGRGIELEGRLFLSEAAHLVLPYHPWLETLDGQDRRIGTTKRGIGPAYQDKVGRTGIRLQEILDPAHLRRRLEEQVERLSARFRGAGVKPPRPLDSALGEWTRSYRKIARRLRPYVVDTVDLLHGALRRDEKILCEGAQGTFLDVDLGTYPYVTSSSTTVGGAMTGLGLPASAVRRVVGVAKAYATRVGEGPFPTELSGREGERLREKGREFGATTGRPRRVGWCDLVQLRQAVRLNGVTSLFLTKIDILAGMSRLRLCTSYTSGGAARAFPPGDARALSRCRPVYTDVPNWPAPSASPHRFDDFPAAARRYIRRIEDETACPIRMVSVGSSRREVVSVPRRAR